MQFRFDMMVKTPGNFTRLRESLSRAQAEKKRWADIGVYQDSKLTSKERK